MSKRSLLAVIAYLFWGFRKSCGLKEFAAEISTGLQAAFRGPPRRRDRKQRCDASSQRLGPKSRVALENKHSSLLSLKSVAGYAIEPIFIT